MPRTNITGGGVVVAPVRRNQKSLKIFPRGLPILGPFGSRRTLHRPRTARASPTILILIASGLSLLAARNAAHADCASGDGNITSPGTCTTPQNLTGQTGTVVSGATLSTGPNATAYTVSSDNSTVTNSGTVTAQGPQAFLINGSGAVTSPGNIINLTNNGSITGAQGDAIGVARAVNFNLTNTGNIAGRIIYTQDPAQGPGNATLTQAGGTIQGDIQLNGLRTVVNVTGGAINGSIFDVTPASGAAGSSGNRFGTVNFDLGTGTFTTNGTILVGVVNVQSGIVVLQNNIGQRFTNNAILQVNGVRTVSGSFAQSAGGTLVMQITPQSSSQMIIQRRPFGFDGTATLAGTLALSYAPGRYQAHSYTLISGTHDVVFANGQPGASVFGTFSNVTGAVPTPGLSQTIAYGLQEVDLVLSGVAQPTNGTIFPGMTNALLLNGQRVNGILLDRLGSRYAGIADGPFALAGASSAPVRTAQAGNIGTLVGIGSALPEALASEGAWFRGIGSFASVNGSGSMPGFSGKSGGFLAGFDRPVMPGISLGLAAGYQHSDVDEHLASGTVDSGRVAAYGGGWWGPSLLTGTAGYAYDSISTARSLTGFGTASEGHDGHEFSVAGQWSLPALMPGIAGPAVITPKLGIQYLHLSQNGFRETGADGSNLSSRGNDADSLQPYLGIAAAEKFVTADGAEITPELRLGYSHEVLNNNRLFTVAAIDGTRLVASGVRPSRDMLTAGLGLTVRAQDNLLLYANYDVNLPTGNTTNQTVSAGLRIRF